VPVLQHDERSKVKTDRRAIAATAPFKLLPLQWTDPDTGHSDRYFVVSVLLGGGAASLGNWSSTFREKIVVLSSRVEMTKKIFCGVYQPLQVNKDNIFKHNKTISFKFLPSSALYFLEPIEFEITTLDGF
jgi:hypothetical protein